MKRILAFIAAALLSIPALAADVSATLTVMYERQKVFSQTTTFHGVTDDQAAALRQTANQTLDYASRRQNKESCKVCPYSIEWVWGNDPAIITERHTFAGTNAILRQGVRWLDDRVTAAEINRARGKSKPWGN